MSNNDARPDSVRSSTPHRERDNDNGNRSSNSGNYRSGRNNPRSGNPRSGNNNPRSGAPSFNNFRKLTVDDIKIKKWPIEEAGNWLKTKELLAEDNVEKLVEAQMTANRFMQQLW